MGAENNILPLQTKTGDEDTEDDANLLQLPQQQLPAAQSACNRLANRHRRMSVHPAAAEIAADFKRHLDHQ